MAGVLCQTLQQRPSTKQEIVEMDRAAVLAEAVAVVPLENGVHTVTLGLTVWKSLGLKGENALEMRQGQRPIARTQRFFAGTVGTQATGKKNARSSIVVMRPGPEAGKSRKLREQMLKLVSGKVEMVNDDYMVWVIDSGASHLICTRR